MENTITGVVSGFAYEKKEREAHPKNTRGHCGWRKGHRHAHVCLLVTENESGRVLEIDMYDAVRSLSSNTAINEKVVDKILGPKVGLIATIWLDYYGRPDKIAFKKPCPA